MQNNLVVSEISCTFVFKIKTMNLKTLKQELLNKPSYFKESVATISNRFKVPNSLVRKALEELQEERREYNRKQVKVVDDQRLSDAVSFYKKSITSDEAKKIIESGKGAVLCDSEGASIFVNTSNEQQRKLEELQQLNRLAKNFGIDAQTLNALLLKNVQEEDGDVPLPFVGGNPKNTLVIGDTHLPFEKPGYLEFCRKVQEDYNCGSVVHIGDLVDNHAVSYHESDSEGRSAGDEYKLALEKCHKWYKVFPEVKICIGNHDALPFRKAFSAGLPSAWLKSYQQILESPKGWEWDFVHHVNGIIYQHGTGMSGEMAAVNAARENRQSTVIGHLHTVSNIKYMASYKDLIFGMTVGCGIDFEAYAFAYGKQQTRKPVVSCAVVIDGRIPIIIPMEL